MSENKAIDPSYLFEGERGGDCEPIEAWQIEAVERLPGDRESREWGMNGAVILSWFDLGETRSQLYDTPLTELPEVVAQSTVWERVKGWFMTLAGNPPLPYRLVGAPV